ncbi:MAG TPA: PAS domain S-box protein [Burkholderiales bacterium]|nr:PAS domain S-box protein [Burkholderiales bacterium]
MLDGIGMADSHQQPQRTVGIDEPFRKLVEGVRDYAIFLLDPEGHILTWNTGAQLIKGYRADEIIGSHFSRFYPAEAIERRWPQQELEAAAAQGRFEDEGWRVRKDGSLFWANVVITAMRRERGELQGFSKVTRDLTERRREENVLRESEERFRLLVESVKDYAIFLLDAEGRMASWNAGAERIKGYKAAEIIGRHSSVFYPREARERGWPEQELAAAREQGRFEEEGVRVRKDGSTFWASVVVTPVFDAEGGLRGYAKVTRDLSDRKRIEQLERAERQTNEFLAMLAHELRNPLAPITNALNLLSRKPTREPGELWVREVLERQTAQLSRLVDNLLDVSRLTRSAVVLDRRPVDLRNIVRNAVDASMQWIRERAHRVEISLPEDRLMVDGDEVRLNQVVQNLVHNAAKYTPNGGCIQVSAGVESGRIVIRVRDNGVGMDAELLRSAFELFRQANQSLDRPQGGLGVGLTLVQRLVALHGGSVEARSDGPGLGSEFAVRLPMREEPPIIDAQSQARAAPAQAPGRPRRVLVVDDNQDAAQALRLLLQGEGHDVKVALDGSAGLVMAREYRPEIVLLDIGLPKMNGYEIARLIRDDATLKGTTLVAVTGYGQMHDRARASASGFDHHMVKPVDFEVLQRLLYESA